MAEHFKPKSIYAQDVEKKNGSEHFVAPVRTGSPTRITRDTSVKPVSQCPMPPHWWRGRVRKQTHFVAKVLPNITVKGEGTNCL